MYGFLLAVLMLDGIFLAIVILLQSGKGGGLAAMGGGVSATEGVLAGRQATTVLTRATWITGGLFMGLALVLSIMSSRAAQPTSVLDDLQAPSTQVPEPILPGLSDPGASGGDPSGVTGETPPPTGGSGGDPGGN